MSDHDTFAARARADIDRLVEQIERLVEHRDELLDENAALRAQLAATANDTDNALDWVFHHD